MDKRELEEAARAAQAAADAARGETLPRFRRVGAETKADGSPVTEADRAAEQAIRAVLRERSPGNAIHGEEYGSEGAGSRFTWLVDPIDGTIAYSRGLPLFSTILALLDGDEPVLGLIDLPALGERYLGWRGAGCRRNGEPVRVSQAKDLRSAMISHGDPLWFERCGEREAFLRMAAEIPMLRGYTDAFGHAMVLGGGVDAMVDLHLNPWDAAATRVLVPEAGGRCETLTYAGGKLGLVFGSPPLVETLLGFLKQRA
jgi:histidinol phosphatase-like enzyme (inositol monophosphatase family)